MFFEDIFLHKRVPAPEELIDSYFAKYKSYFSFDGDLVTYNSRVYNKDTIIARILRTYPSLIREFHFFLMLTKEKCFQSVIYSCQYDMKGRDIIIKHGSKEFEVSLYVDTKRSRFYKTIKNLRRHLYGKNEIQVPLNLGGARKCGDFYLYDKKHIELVKKRILN